MNDSSADMPGRDGGVERIEALLGAGGRPGPTDAFRARVLAGMEEAHAERRDLLARQTAGGTGAARVPVRSEAVAGAAAALLVLGVAWLPAGRVPAGRVPEPVPEAAVGPSAAGDVERAIELLEARRHRFLDVGIKLSRVGDVGVRGEAGERPHRS